MGLMNINTMSEQEVIKILEENGIRVVYKPCALLPDVLENYHGIGTKSNGFIETDIYEALNKLQIRKSIVGDPFS